jgi:hypothetical protein
VLYRKVGDDIHTLGTERALKTVDAKEKEREGELDVVILCVAVDNTRTLLLNET